MTQLLQTRAKILVLLGLAFIPSSKAEDKERYLPVTATASPQSNPQRYARIWDVSVCNDGLDPISVNGARLSREFSGKLSFLNTHARSYAQTRTNESVAINFGDLFSDLALGFVSAIGTGAIEYSGKGLPIGFAIGSGGWKIGKKYLLKKDDQSFKDQIFWDDSEVTVAPNSICVSRAIAALRPDDKKARKELEKTSIEVRFKDRRPTVTSPSPVMPTIDPEAPSVDQGIFLSFYRFEDRETSVVF